MTIADLVDLQAGKRALAGMPALAALFLFFSLGAAAASEVRINGFHFVQETVRGPWTIEADSAVFREGEEVVLEAVSARMVSRDGEEFSVTGDRGRYDPENQVLNLEGHVLAHHGRGFTLKARKVRWEGSGAALHIRDGVEMRGRTILVQGESARYDLDVQTVLFTGGVRTTLRPGGALP